jgi:RHS repeat-associated protein
VGGFGTDGRSPAISISEIQRRSVRVRLRAGAIAAFAVVLAVALTPVQANALGSAPTGKPKPPVAPAGRGPAKVSLPWAAQPNRGLPKGQRTPVEPPRLRVSAPSSGHPMGHVRPFDGGPGGGGNGPTATNLSLLPGLAVNDTSLIAYYDAPATGWTQGTVSLFADADHTTVLHQATFTFDQAQAQQQCRSKAQFCFTLANSDSWGLVVGTAYVVTVTLTATDGSQTASDFSPVATPRALPTPPALPAEQVRGDLGTGSSGRLDAQPAIRGVGVNTATGAFTQQGADAALASSYVINIQMQRAYNSNDTSASLMGVGWSFAYDARVFPKPGATDGSVVFRAEDGAETVYTRQTDGSYASPPGVFSKLSAVAGGGWHVDTPGGQQRLSFDAAGKMLSILDKRGKGVTVGYDSGGQPSTLTDAGGRVVTLTVSGGRLTSFTLPDRRPVFYSYQNDRLRTARDPDGDVTTYDYDAAGRLVKITDSLGHVQLTNTYDATSGQVTAQTDALGHKTIFAWDAGKQESTVTDPDGVVVHDGYLNNVLQFTQIGNNTTVHRADANGNTQVLGDAQGNQFDSAHDGDGNTTSTTALGGSGAPTETADHDASKNVKSFTDARGNTTTYTFNDFNQPLSVKDPLGNVTTFVYDGNGLMTSMTDALGHTTTLAYDGAGNKIAQTDPDGNKTTYAYDASGRMLSITDPRGNVTGANPASFTTTSAYDGEDRVRQVTDPLGHFKKWDYDNAGRLHAYTDPNTFQSVYDYNDANQLVTAHDADLRVTNYAYTPGGRLQKQTNGVGGATTYTYDDAGRTKTVTSPRGNVPGANAADFTTTYTYDGNGNKTSDSHPFPGSSTPAVTRYKYDVLNHLIAVTDPLGRTGSTAYDVAGNPISTTDPLGNTTTSTYDADNRMVSTTDPLGHTSTQDYDAAGRVDFKISPGGEKFSFGLDAAGRLVSQTSPRGNAPGADPAAFTTRFGYDPAGNRLSTTDPLGQTSTSAYDAANNVLKQTDANGHATTYTYDADNRLITIQSPDSKSTTQVTTNGYDHAGNLITRTNPLGFSTRYTYDGAGRLATVTDELGRIRQYNYDADSNVVATLTARATSTGDPAGRAANTITQQYDILDRVTSRTVGNGRSYSYGYDAADQVVSLADSTGTQTRSYDLGGRLTGVSGGASGTFGYTYDTTGNLLTRTVPDGGTQTLAYDADNRPTSLTASAGKTTYGYDEDGNLTDALLPGGSGQKRTYDAAERLTTLTDQAPGGGVLSAYTITRDKVGNPTRLDTVQAAASHSDAFTYDVVNRLTAACFGTTTCSGATQKLSYSYDLVGNRLTRTRTGTGAFKQTYTYDAANELTATSGGPQGSVSYSYDPDGNQITAGKVHTTYDLDNKVTAVDDGANKTAYTQDAAGNRVAADTTPDKGGATTHTSYRWDVNNAIPMLASEQTGTGPARSYTYNPNRSPLALSTAGADYLYQPDPFGNTAELTDLTGTVLQQSTLTDPFGEFSQSKPGGGGVPDPRLQFQGEYNDPLSGNYHLRARDYATGSGRFTSVDPVPQSATASAESAYAFGGDNPLTNSDPSGLGCGWFSGICNAVSHAASAVVNTVTTAVDTVSTAVTDVVDSGIQLVKDTVSDIKTAATKVVNTAVQVTKTVTHTVATGVKTAAHWVDQHKAAIAGIAAGIVAGALCEAVTAGAGSIGCAALAGAVGNMVQYAVGTPTNQWSLGGFLKTGAEGALTGAIGGVAGKFLGSAVAGLGGKVFGKALGIAEEGAEGAEGTLAGEGAEAAETAGTRAATEGEDAAAAGEGSTPEEGATGPSCPTHSFDPHTQVLMADRSRKAIQDIRIGDQVATADLASTGPVTGGVQSAAVTMLHINQDEALTDVTVAAGDGRTDTIHTTQHHPFWDSTDGSWTEAGGLRPGDELRTSDGGTERVVGVRNFTGNRQMRDLTLATIHTYYVIAAGVGVLVHNCGGDLPAPQLTQRGLDHSFDRHAAQWFGRPVAKADKMEQWTGLIQRASGSSKVVPWSSGGTLTNAYVARIEGKWFAAQFDRESGELVTAFVPNRGQVGAMLRLLGKA